MGIYQSTILGCSTSRRNFPNSSVAQFRVYKPSNVLRSDNLHLSRPPFTVEGAGGCPLDDRACLPRIVSFRAFLPSK